MQTVTPLYHLTISAFFAAALAVYYVILTYDVLKLRQKKRIPVGDGNDEELTRARAAHENYTDNSLFFIILMAFAEANDTNSFALISLGLIFVAARALHAHSVKVYEKEKKSYGLRALAIMVTFGVIVVLALINLYISLF